jgi:hypothetical protein
MKHNLMVWVVTNGEYSFRMCLTCGFTQFVVSPTLAPEGASIAWIDVPNSVIGVNCLDQAPSPDALGYSTPTQAT